MKPLLNLALLWICLFCITIGYAPAQQVSVEKLPQWNTDRKWSVSLSIGATLSGRRNSMLVAMEEEGFNDWYTELIGFIGLSYTKVTKYPKDKAKGAEWGLEVRRKLSPYASLALSYGRSQTLVTEGHNIYATDLHHFLGLETSYSVITCDFIFTKKNSYSGFKIGPALAIHLASDGYSEKNLGSVTTVKPGLHLGYGAALFQKKSWFMAFGMDYTWITSVTVGPYSEEETRLEDGEMQTYTSVFDPVKLSLSFLKIGITTGWKF